MFSGRTRDEPATAHARVATPPSVAAVVGFGLGALVNAPLLARAARGTGASRLLVHLTDSAYFLAAGLLAAAVVALFRYVPARARRLDAWALFAGAVAAGSVVLEYDLEHFSQRHAERAPPWLTQAALTALLATSLPAALVLGRRLRRHAVGRGAALGIALAAYAGNALLLVGDYEGVHLYAALAAAILAGAALVGLEIPCPPPPSIGAKARALRIGLRLLAAALVVAAILLKPPARVAVALAQSTGSVLAPFAGQLRARILGSGTRGTVPSDAWFRDRSKEPPVPPAWPPLLPAKRAVVVLLTVDALRADLVNSREHDATLPNLAKLRDRSVWFTEARATGTLTRVSISTLFTGKYFSQQYWSKPPEYPVPMPFEDDSVRFPDLLRRAGARTKTILSIPWLTNYYGVARGFDTDERVPEPGKYTASPAMYAKAIEILRRVDDRPLFFFMHLSDPHEPYDLGEVEGPAFERYLAEVALVDRGLGELFALLDGPELGSRSALIVSADHGEAFREHGARTHGTTLYDEALRVPLLVWTRRAQPRRVDELVSLIDVGPTVLDLMGLDTPGHFLGQSLTPFLRGESPALTRPIVAETRQMRSYVTKEQLKVIADERSGRVELYDLKKDPGEHQNLADDEALLEKPLAALRAFVEVHRIRRSGYEPPNLR